MKLKLNKDLKKEDWLVAILLAITLYFYFDGMIKGLGFVMAVIAGVLLIGFIITNI